MSESLVVICNALNSLPSSVIIFDKEGKILDANQAACLTHGVERISDLGAAVSHEILEQVGNAIKGEYCTAEYKTTNKKTGKELWLRAKCNPVYTTEGTPSGVSVFEKDITAQKALITELKSMKAANV